MDKQNDILKIDLQGMAPLMQVFDMPTSLKFYRDILGFKVVQSSGEGDNVDWVLLELNKIELMLNSAYEKEYRPANPMAGAYCNAYRYLTIFWLPRY